MELLLGLIAIQELLISLKLALFCYTGYRCRDRRKKGEGRARKGKRERVPLDCLDCEGSWVGPRSISSQQSLFCLYEKADKKANPPSHVNKEKLL